VPDGLQLAGAFLLALTAALVFVPIAMRIALRTGFVDVPGGYKGHAQPTPYLGGMAVVGAVAIALFVSGAGTSRFAALFVWAFVLFVVGTVDDKRNLNPMPRLAIEAFAAFALWHYGLGWAVFGSDILNIALTVIWVVGLVNAFNLMDNMDGAASTVAGVCATGIAGLGIVYGDIALAATGAAVAGGCVGFLRYNLARPARIFLGDGGSMPIGFVIAGAVMAAPGTQGFGWSALLAMAPMVGLPILDTTLVVISRRRARRPVLSGGRDHLTHRLRAMVGGSVGAVVVSLAAVQAVLCLVAIAAVQVGAALAVVAAVAFAVAGGFAIFVLETPGRGRLATVSRALPADPAQPEKSAA
jgi:UDP-GlcNAc:undecaprenyl-phosphate/decaprenyl-phosphate GlcNAc-1-phosphate transferase